MKQPDSKTPLAKPVTHDGRYGGDYGDEDLKKPDLNSKVRGETDSNGRNPRYSGAKGKENEKSKSNH